MNGIMDGTSEQERMEARERERERERERAKERRESGEKHRERIFWKDFEFVSLHEITRLDVFLDNFLIVCLSLSNCADILVMSANI